MKQILLLTILALALIGCEKIQLSDVIEGQVVDKGNGVPIAGATVVFEINEWADNEEIFIQKHTIIADNQGRFNFKRNAGYEFVSATVSGYLDLESNRVPISPDSELKIELSGEAWLAIRMLNVGDTDEDDRALVYPHFLGESPFPYILDGSNVDSTIIGKVRAHDIWDIRWRTFHHGDMEWHFEQTVCPINDTLLFLIAY